MYCKTESYYLIVFSIGFVMGHGLRTTGLKAEM